jgi:membrane-associated protein
MSLIHQLVDLALHLDKHLNSFAGEHQVGVYVLLAAVIFCETGLVVWPFLPGDSLLFAVGALAATVGSPINLLGVIVLLCVCANCGDILNYTIGLRVGPKVFSRESSWLLNKKHLEEAHRFYERHGRKTIILARFVPIIRTFAPFVAGIGRMPFSRFIGFSVSGGVLWVCTMTLAGYFFGQIGVVKSHFEIVILAIIAISLLPMVFHAVQARGKSVESVEVKAE